MKKRRIGILTGGGDVPGLNSVIKSVVYRGWENGLEVVGIRKGFEGLTHVDLDDPASRARYVIDLNRENTRTIDRHGGTFLHSSRVGPTTVRDLPPHLVGRNIPAHKGKAGHDLRPHHPGPREPGPPGDRVAHRHRRRRHAQVGRPARSTGREGDGDPQDHGQRRPGHRVLHRLLHGHHPGHRRHRPAAHHHRLPRAGGHLPGLREGRRLHRPLRGPRHLQPVRHPRVPGGPREAHRPPPHREA